MAQKLLLISDEFRRCHASFKGLLSASLLERQGLLQSSWQDQLDRLRIWADNSEAHQTTQSSLDYTLRDASHIRSQVIDLLRSIERQLREVRATMSISALAQIITATDMEDEDLAELRSFEAAIPSNENSSDQDESNTDVQECYNVIVNAIDCLYQTSMLIHSPARHDRLVEPSMGIINEFSLSDERHVSDKFPKADPTIANRLGNAITQRRRDFDQRRRHQAELRRGLDEAQGLKLNVLSDTDATKYIHPEANTDDTSSLAIVSAVTQISPLPPKLDGKHGFECEYCGLPNVIVSDVHEWTSHVLKDLYPYVCLYEPCTTPNLMYDSSQVWFNHMLSSHISPPREPIAGVPLQNIPSTLICPLCREKLGFEEAQNHMARHLVEQAVWCLSQLKSKDSSLNDKNINSFQMRIKDANGQSKRQSTNTEAKKTTDEGLGSNWKTATARLDWGEEYYNLMGEFPVGDRRRYMTSPRAENKSHH